MSEAANQATSPRILGTDLLAATLDHEPLPADEIDEGAPTTAIVDLGSLGDVDTGIWEMTTGVARDTEAEEIFLVLSGAGEVEFEDGSVIELRAGTAVRLHAGERTRWRITQTLRKVYIAVA